MQPRITYDLEVAEVIKSLRGIEKGISAALARIVKKTAQKSLKLAKPKTPKATGRKGRGRKAGGVKRLSQSLKVSAWSRRGKHRAAVSWGGQRGFAAYANFLNYGALRYTRRKVLVRKDGKPNEGKLPRVNMVNQHNSRRSRHKGWANQLWIGLKRQTENIFVSEAKIELAKRNPST